MYVTTRDGLGQASRLSGSMAGMLGQAPTVYQTRLLQFRERVHQRPQDYKKLLLTARLHPFPGISPVIGGYPISEGQLSLLDHTVMAGASWDELLDELYRISDRKLGREIEAEKQLWAKIVKAIQKLGPDKLKRFLLEPALLDPKRLQTNPGSLSNDFLQLGRSFRSSVSPSKEPGLKELREVLSEIGNSTASEAHDTTLGWRLARMAYALKNTDRAFKKDVDAFKKVVDQERRRRQKAAQAFKRKQQKKTAPVKKKKP